MSLQGIQHAESEAKETVSYLLHATGELLIAHVHRAGNGPVVGLPPPSPDASANTLAGETARSAIPVPPTSDNEGPEQALGQGHEDLISKSDPGNLLPSVGMLDTGKIALFEAEVGQGRKLVRCAWSGSKNRDGDFVVVDIVGKLIEIGRRVEADWQLLRGSCGRIDVVSG